MDNNFNNIKKLYDKSTYFDQYSGSLVLFIIITIIVVILISYFHIMINAQPIINDWPNQRCKPNIMPIAGFITHPEGITAIEYTAQNFTYCTQNILSGTSGIALQPLTFVASYLGSMANVIESAIQSIRGMFDKIRTSMQNVTEEIMGRLMNIMVPLMQIIISFRDLIGKIQGTMTASLYTTLGSYFALKSLMGAIVQFIITILVTLAALIMAFWAVPFMWGAAAANTAIFVAIAIPLAIIISFMNKVLHIDTKFKIPKVKCFDKDTLLKMNDGSLKKIVDIEVGNILYNNNTVTAKIKVTKEGSIMYNLNDVLVSDSHIVKYNNTWIPVSKHPDALKIELYNESFLYCLNTINKFIEINGTIFTDWDEIYQDSLNKVVNNNILPVISEKCIHEYLDSGVSSSTKIKLLSNELIDINKIKINDILQNGIKVYGIVEIDGSNIDKQYRYILGKDTYIEGYLPFLNNYIERKIVNKNEKLYHLLTDKGYFKIENIFIQDYNGVIDRLVDF